MANANSIIIRNSKKSSTPSAGNLAHNSTLRKASYWLDKDKQILQSYKPYDLKEVNRIWQNWCNMAKARYLQNHKRNIRADAVLIEEGLIVIGKDVVADDKLIEKIAKDFFAKFEKDNNTRVLHYAVHTHEGHLEGGTQEINRHIHFLFDNVDKDGNMVRRNWKRSYLKQLQDDIYNASKKHIANIKRATDYQKLGQKAPKQTHHRVFRTEKKQEQKAKELAKQKDLKEEIKELRAELKQRASTRADYAKLEALNRELKEQVKAKDLTLQDLKEQIETYKNELRAEQEHNDLLKSTNMLLEKQIENNSNELKKTVLECNEEVNELVKNKNAIHSPVFIVKLLKKKIIELLQEKNSLKKTVKALLSDLKQKEEENIVLKEKINSRANMSVLTTKKEEIEKWWDEIMQNNDTEEQEQEQTTRTTRRLK